MKTVVAIPTLNSIGWVAPLVEHLLLADKVDEVWVYDNNCTDSTADWVRHRRLTDKRLFLIDAAGMGFYQMWNDMVKKANALDDQVNLAMLNSDIRLPIDGIHKLSKVMRENNYQIASVDPGRPAMYSQHFALWGQNIASTFGPDFDPYPVDAPPGATIAWAFVMAAEFWKDEPYAVYPGYQWWYGDDDLFKRAYARGARICKVIGVGSDHLGSSSDGFNPRKDEMIKSDEEIYKKMWLGI